MQIEEEANDARQQVEMDKRKWSTMNGTQRQHRTGRRQSWKIKTQRTNTQLPPYWWLPYYFAHH